MTLAQLTFLIFSSIQCHASQDSSNFEFWMECNRTLFAQTGLGLIVVLFMGIRIVSGVAPKYIVERHTISIKKIATMRLN